MLYSLCRPASLAPPKAGLCFLQKWMSQIMQELSWCEHMSPCHAPITPLSLCSIATSNSCCFTLLSEMLLWLTFMSKLLLITFISKSEWCFCCVFYWLDWSLRNSLNVSIAKEIISPVKKALAITKFSMWQRILFGTSQFFLSFSVYGVCNFRICGAWLIKQYIN